MAMVKLAPSSIEPVAQTTDEIARLFDKDAQALGLTSAEAISMLAEGDKIDSPLWVELSHLALLLR
jgi:hypothetical protein